MVLEENIKNTNFDTTMMDWESKQNSRVDLWNAFIERFKILYYET